MTKTPPTPKQSIDLTRAGWPHVDTVQVLLLDNAKPLRGTRWAGVYQPVTTRPAYDCAHEETVCTECLPEWQTDYIVRIFEHDANAYTARGCRCTTCLVTNQERYRGGYQGRGPRHSVARRWEPEARA